jgi:nitrogen regulatory protein P-II 1
MLKIEAYIRPSSLPFFHAALLEAGVTGVTVWQTKGIGQHFHANKKPEMYRGAAVKESYIDRVRLDTIVEDEQKDTIIAALTRAAEDNDVGTLQLFVTPVLEAIRVPMS